MEVWANDMLLDRVITTEDGDHIGTVDNLELSDLGAGLEVTALLCGATAFGPRLGGRLGAWWSALGGRLHPDPGEDPVRIPLDTVKALDRRRVAVRGSGEELGAQHVQHWLRDHFVARIPGSGADARH
jgi:sporulation protein YlmC with PRC-barrel domain